MSSGSRQRRIVQTKTARFRTYDMEGPVQPEMSLLALSFDDRTSLGTYLMRMDLGAGTIPHTHRHREEYMVLEGHLIEDDATVLGPGDYVCFEEGSQHNSRTEDGCLLIVFEWRTGA